MKSPSLHSWRLDPAEARRLQSDLAPRLILRGGPRSPRVIAGADVAVLPVRNRLVAAVVVLRRPPSAGTAEWEVVEQVLEDGPADFPYVPGLLSFREAPILLDCFARLQTTPDLVLVDGQGIAHPREFGLASHLGLWLDIPTVGCAKSRLVGEYAEPGPEVGDWSPLTDGRETLGRVLRARSRVKPVFVSVGHRLGLAGATKLLLACGRGYRLPEPTRRAHHLVNDFRKQDSC